MDNEETITLRTFLRLASGTILGLVLIVYGYSFISDYLYVHNNFIRIPVTTTTTAQSYEWVKVTPPAAGPSK